MKKFQSFVFLIILILVFSPDRAEKIPPEMRMSFPKTRIYAVTRLLIILIALTLSMISSRKIRKLGKFNAA